MDYRQFCKNTPLNDCYAVMAHNSALYIGKLRAAKLRNTGQPPLTPQDQYAFYIMDYPTSFYSFKKDDEDEEANVELTQPFITPDGYHPYSPDQITQAQLESNLAAVQQTEQASLQAAIDAGKLNATQALAVSQAMPTDPLGKSITQALTTEIVASGAGISQGGTLDNLASRVLAGPTDAAKAAALLPVDPNVKARADMPTGLDNVLTQSDQAKAVAQLGNQIYQQTADSYRTSELPVIEQTRQVNDYNYWTANYPTVEMKPEDNPNTDPNLLKLPYNGDCWSFSYKGNVVYGRSTSLPFNPAARGGTKCTGAPLTLIRVTPRQKPIPKLGWLASNPWLSTVVSVIPIVGQYVGIILKIASASQIKNYAMAWQTPVDAFQPQYYPQAFFVILPLDRAQVAVSQPWFVPYLHKQFQSQIQQASLNVMGFA